jgi:hypothetical protein
MKSRVAQEIFQLRNKMLEAIRDEPARYQTEVARLISHCADYLTALAQIHEHSARRVD